MTQLIPTEADRATYIAFNNLPGVDLAAVRAGEWDNTTGMQIIASRALTARIEALEEVVIWLRGPAFQSRHPEDAAFARHVALAIEQGHHRHPTGAA